MEQNTFDVGAACKKIRHEIRFNHRFTRRNIKQDTLVEETNVLIRGISGNVTTARHGKCCGFGRDLIANNTL